jgi:hypothetical protein
MMRYSPFVQRNHGVVSVAPCASGLYMHIALMALRPRCSPLTNRTYRNGVQKSLTDILACDRCWSASCSGTIL